MSARIRRRGPPQRPEPREQCHQHGAGRRAQGTRSVAGELELPPELVRVLDVTVREEHEPDGGAQCERDGGAPRRRERRAGECGAAIEIAVARQEQEQHHREDAGLFVVGAFQQREHDAARQHPHRREVRGVEPALQIAREQQEPHADEAAEEMRALDDGPREHLRQPVEPLRDRGHGTGEKQEEAARERAQRERARHERRRPRIDEVRDPAHRRPVHAHLAHDEQRHRERERHQVVDHAIGDERGQKLRARMLGAEEQQERRLEHAEPARHVAHDADRLRQEKAAEEARQRHDDAVRQEHPERGGREGPVERARQELRRHEARVWERDLPLAHDERRPAHDRRDDVRRDRDRQQHADEPRAGERQMQRRRQRARRHDEDDRAQRRQAEPERQRAERDDARHFARGESPAGVEAVAHGAAAQEGDAGGLAERKAQERRQRRAPVGQGTFDVAARERVVGGERAVPEAGRDERQHEARRRQRRERVLDLVVVVAGEGVVEQPERDRERDERREGGQPGELRAHRGYGRSGSSAARAASSSAGRPFSK